MEVSMCTGEEENLEGFEVETVANIDPNGKRKRCIAIKKLAVAEEKVLLDFLMEHREFERPTAQSYYKRFADVSKSKVEWTVARSKVRNMRTAYNKAKSWEGSTGAGSMTGETIRATLLRKFPYFYEFDDLFGGRLVHNVVIEDTLDGSFASNVFNSTEIEETTTSSVGGERITPTTSSVGGNSIPPTSRRGIYSRTGVSDIMDLHTEMMKVKQAKYEKDAEYRDKEIGIREQELALKRLEMALKQKEIESRERMQIRELEMKERLAMEEFHLKYRTNN